MMSIQHLQGRSTADYLEAVHRLLMALRRQALSTGDDYTVSSANEIIDTLDRLAEVIPGNEVLASLHVLQQKLSWCVAHLESVVQRAQAEGRTAESAETMLRTLHDPVIDQAMLTDARMAEVVPREAAVTLVYREAIRGVLDLPWPGAEVHNRYLHFVLDHGRMPNNLETMNQINVNHERYFGHPFVQAEGTMSQGQCRDCLSEEATPS